MIKFVDDKNDIISLWQEAFGDSKEDIEFFINNCCDYKCIGYYSNKILTSMLFLVECQLNLEKSNYIYAACTFDKYKKRGYMTKLIEHCVDNYGNICLIPANESLIDYYKNRKLDNEYDVSNLKFNQIEEINEYLFEGCSLNKPIVLSNI